MTEINLPISKLSYSSLTQLLRNPIIFKLKEILGVYDVKMSVSAAIGKGVHEALKFYYGGNKDVPCPADQNEARPLAKEFGLKYLAEIPDGVIRYGKTGSREGIYAGFTQAMDFYFAEEPVYSEILMVEEKMEAQIKSYTGDIMPLPAVGIPDLVSRENSGVDIVDIKVVKSFTAYENEDGDPHEDYIKVIQAKFMGRLLKAAKDIDATRVVFRELKRTKNADGKPQIRDYVIPLNHEPYDIIFDNLYKDVYKFISNPDAVYLPNLSDPYDGEHAGLIYAQGLISSDMSDVEVVHKVREVALTSKKFVGSRLDSEINRNLLPEEKIKIKLAEFGIPVEPVDTQEGASVTQYRFKVSAGVRMSTIKKHHDDILKALSAKGEVRLLTPIPGTSLVGIEVERDERHSVKLGEQHMTQRTLNLPLGVDVQGQLCSLPLNEMPHLLVAGTTGSGKSMLLHSIIEAITSQLSSDDLRLLLIDPKRVEFAGFKKLPHLMQSPIYEYKNALRAISGLVDEMERRYVLLESAGKREIGEYNDSKRKSSNKLPYIVMIVDEFGDFMIQSRDEERRAGKSSYASKSKRWLERELIKRAAKSGFILLPDENDTGHDIKIRISGEYDKSELVDILERHDLADPLKGVNVETLIVRLAQMSRAVGIHVILATQRPSSDVITGLIRANIPTRIAMTTASAVESGVIGIPGAEKLAGKGDLLLLTPLIRGVKRLQGFII